jgi:genome maintenance exonuclease 1
METIVDFKQANKPKKDEWIQDYYLQIAAYAMAHDYVHESKIRQGVIMVCTPDLYYQEFKMQDADLRKWKHEWLKRMNQYYEMLHDEKEQAQVRMNPEDFFNGA